MHPGILLSNHAASELVDLAWELTCSANVAVKIDVVNTDRGSEACVSAFCVEGRHAFMLVPRGAGYVEVWWGEYDAAPALVGTASDVTGILEMARRVA